VVRQRAPVLGEPARTPRVSGGAAVRPGETSPLGLVARHGTAGATSEKRRPLAAIAIMSIFSCSASSPHGRKHRRGAGGASSDRPRATIQRSASSSGLRRGASSSSKLCDADKFENLTAGLSSTSLTGWAGAAADGQRAPLSPLTVNSPSSGSTAPRQDGEMVRENSNAAAARLHCAAIAVC
jgi:hypothetical protein